MPCFPWYLSCVPGGTFSGRTALSTGRFARPPAFPQEWGLRNAIFSRFPAVCRVDIKLHWQDAFPAQQQVCGPRSKENIFPSVGQGRHGFEDTGNLQHPLRILSSLLVHWTDKPFEWLQAESAPPTSPSRTSRKVSYIINFPHRIVLHYTTISTKHRYMDHLIGEAIENELLPNKMNGEVGF